MLIVCYWKPLGALIALALSEDLHSHVILIPFASAYLVWMRRKQLPRRVSSSFPSATLFAVAAGFALAVGIFLSMQGDALFWMIVSLVLFGMAALAAFLGIQWISAMLFPLCFLFFTAPVPASAAHWIENASKLASAEMANVLFTLAGTTCLREGTIFHLPGIVLEVAQECSGIRSSLVLVITAIFAANLLLTSTWARGLLVAIVIPLGILRNAFRIFVIGTLCVVQGPHMVHSPIHHRGGPIFFVISLIPLIGILWWLRRRELRSQAG